MTEAKTTGVVTGEARASDTPAPSVWLKPLTPPSSSIVTRSRWPKASAGFLPIGRRRRSRHSLGRHGKQDPEEVRAWTEEIYPAIGAKAKREKALILWAMRWICAQTTRLGARGVPRARPR